MEGKQILIWEPGIKFYRVQLIHPASIALLNSVKNIDFLKYLWLSLRDYLGIF
jgi:hypothetical protein